MTGNDAAFERTLTVSGTGVVEGPADRCLLRVALAVTSEGNESALGELAQVVSAVVGGLREAGIVSEHIRTTNVTLGERRRGPEDQLVGRTAKYWLSIAAPNLERTGELLSLLAGLAADHLEVGGLELSLSDATTLMRDARRLAVLDAQAKAADFAAAAGVALGPILSIEDDSGGRSGPRRAGAKLVRATSAAPVPPMPLEGGPLAVTSAVTVVYAIA